MCGARESGQVLGLCEGATHTLDTHALAVLSPSAPMLDALILARWRTNRRWLQAVWLLLLMVVAAPTSNPAAFCTKIQPRSTNLMTCAKRYGHSMDASVFSSHAAVCSSALAGSTAVGAVMAQHACTLVCLSLCVRAVCGGVRDHVLLLHEMV